MSTAGLEELMTNLENSAEPQACPIDFATAAYYAHMFESGINAVPGPDGDTWKTDAMDGYMGQLVLQAFGNNLDDVAKFKDGTSDYMLPGNLTEKTHQALASDPVVNVQMRLQAGAKALLRDKYTDFSAHRHISYRDIDDELLTILSTAQVQSLPEVQKPAKPLLWRRVLSDILEIPEPAAAPPSAHVSLVGPQLEPYQLRHGMEDAAKNIEYHRNCLFMIKEYHAKTTSIVPSALSMPADGDERPYGYINWANVNRLDI